MTEDDVCSLYWRPSFVFPDAVEEPITVADSGFTSFLPYTPKLALNLSDDCSGLTDGDLNLQGVLGQMDERCEALLPILVS